MANRSRSLQEIGVDILQAVRRAVMYRDISRLEPKPAPKEAKVKKPASKKTDRKPTIGEEVATSYDTIDTENTEVKEESTSTDREEKEAAEGPEKLIELDERTHEILYQADTVFPFTLFPDTVTLDREKLTVAERFFWRVAKITTVPVSEILTCNANIGPFFGSLHLVFSFFADNQRDIKFLWRHDTEELHRMLHGYIIAHKRKINTTGVNIEDLKVLLKDLGQGASD